MGLAAVSDKWCFILRFWWNDQIAIFPMHFCLQVCYNMNVLSMVSLMHYCSTELNIKS
jgi:hypothetical protein